MQHLQHTDAEIYGIIQEEDARQRQNIELIASENFTSPSVIEAMGSVLTNKYAEGLPGKRYYGGCSVVDKAENLARDRARQLFGADWVNVQPHSGAQANAALYLALMNPGDRLLGLDLAHGGHLTHGSPVNFSGLLYEAHFYGVERDGELAGRIDMDKVRQKARQVKPKMISIGASAYPRDFDYKAFREIADEVGAFLWMDMAHTAGLIAAGVLNDPLPHCHVVTTTTHKTLRGPRGGMILVGKDYENPFGVVAPKSGRTRMMSELFDSAVFPGTQGGPLMHVIAGKAVAFGEALTDEFRNYQKQVVMNAARLAEVLVEGGAKLISGGTDNHLMLLDLEPFGISGKDAERRLDEAHITVNKNAVPFDTRSPLVTSGIRIGTPAATTRGMKESDMDFIGTCILEVLKSDSETTIQKVAEEVRSFTERFPLTASSR